MKKHFHGIPKARNAAAGALANGDVAGVSRAEGVLAGMLPKINMVAEQYPQLKADTSFVNLQNQLVALENQLADRRDFTTQVQPTLTLRLKPYQQISLLW